jgi:type I restriction enzyme M protein
LSGGDSKIFCEDSLNPSEYNENVRKSIKNESFDYILTNPPFGAKIPIDEKDLLKKYELGHVWKNYASEGWKKTKSIRTSQPPQILFIERSVQLLKDGGKLGIILPEGIFGNPSDRYIWEFLKQKGRVLGIISLDQNAFQPFTCNKTSILFFQKLEETPEDYKIDFSVVDNVGHDKDGKVCYKLSKDGTPIRDAKGNPIINDDLRDLNSQIENIEDFDYQKEQSCFRIKLSDIKNNIFIPNYYMGVEKKLKKLENNERFELISIQELADKNILYTNRLGYLPRGNEIGSQVYGLGDVPFIRTSEISNWEINLDANKKTSEEVYEKYKEKQNIEVGDILLVKDGGSNLIGKTAFITHLDTKIIIQSHIYQLKTLKNNVAIDPYLILYLLNLDIVQRQIEAITFIQGTIATIGSRVMELKLPFPTDIEKRRDISKYIRNIIDKKTEIRGKIRNLSLEII